MRTEGYIRGDSWDKVGSAVIVSIGKTTAMGVRGTRAKGHCKLVRTTASESITRRFFCLVVVAALEELTTERA